MIENMDNLDIYTLDLDLKTRGLNSNKLIFNVEIVST